MSNKMKAAVLHEFNQPLQIEEVDIPTPGPGQIVVKMQASVSVIPTCTLSKAIGQSNQAPRLSLVMKVSA